MPNIFCKVLTLIELMAIIVIITVLLTLLLPMLKVAKDRTKVIACANNLKQAGVAFELYSADNNNTLPPADIWSPWDYRWISNLLEESGKQPLVFKCPNSRQQYAYATKTYYPQY